MLYLECIGLLADPMHAELLADPMISEYVKQRSLSYRGVRVLTGFDDLIVEH